MSTSDINRRKIIRRYITAYSAAAIFCFIFQLVYEHFSHGVTSYYMVLAFLIPLAGGAINTLSFFGIFRRSGNLFRQLINSGIIWLTLGSIYEGVLEIYGTTNRLIIVFAIVGAVNLLAAVIVSVIRTLIR